MRVERLVLAAALLAGGVFLGCGDKDEDTGGDGGADGGVEDGGADGGSDGGGDGGIDGSWATVSTQLAQSCAFSSCHGGGEFPDLSEGNAYASIVGVASQQAPSETLVVPSDPDSSYLVKKCEAAAGITGDAMPKGSDMWEADKLANLRAWIAAGALEE